MGGLLVPFLEGAGASGFNAAGQIDEDQRKQQAALLMKENLARFGAQQRATLDAASQKQRQQDALALEHQRSEDAMALTKYKLSHLTTKAKDYSIPLPGGQTIPYSSALDTYKAEKKNNTALQSTSFEDWFKQRYGVDTQGKPVSGNTSSKRTPVEVQTLVGNIMQGDPWGPNFLRPGATKQMYGNNTPEEFKAILTESLTNGDAVPVAIQKAKGMTSVNDSTSTSGAQGTPPVPGAVWSKKYKAWYVQKNGVWNKAELQ